VRAIVPGAAIFQMTMRFGGESRVKIGSDEKKKGRKKEERERERKRERERERKREATGQFINW